MRRLLRALGEARRKFRGGNCIPSKSLHALLPILLTVIKCAHGFPSPLPSGIEVTSLASTEGIPRSHTTFQLSPSRPFALSCGSREPSHSSFPDALRSCPFSLNAPFSNLNMLKSCLPAKYLHKSHFFQETAPNHLSQKEGLPLLGSQCVIFILGLQ